MRFREVKLLVRGYIVCRWKSGFEFRLGGSRGGGGGGREVFFGFFFSVELGFTVLLDGVEILLCYK